MSTKPVFTADEVALAVAKRLGGLQALEVKEIQLFPLDGATRKTYGCRYKNWNLGVKSAPVVIWKNRTIIGSGFEITSQKKHTDTPYETVVSENGAVVFADALTVDDVVHAAFTFALFTESDLSVALRTSAFATIAALAPITIDDQAIADFMVEPLILATMIHLREGMLAEQSLYYSYSIQEQSHQLKQVHDNLESDINRDRAALDRLIDSNLWFRLQGSGRRKLSVLHERSTSNVPFVNGGGRRGGWDR